MKRILSFLLALLMVWSLAVPAMAVEVPTEANTFYLDVDKTSVKVGETVTLSVYCNTEMANMASCTVLVDYDETVFQLDLANSSTEGDEEYWGVIDNYHENQGKYTGVSMFRSSSKETIPNGLLTSIKLTALKASDDTSFKIFKADASWLDKDNNSAKVNVDVKFAGPIEMTVTGESEPETTAPTEPELVIPAGAPFTDITTDKGSALKVVASGTLAASYYDAVPYYVVTVPVDATVAYVAHPKSANPIMEKGWSYGIYWDMENGIEANPDLNWTETDDGGIFEIPMVCDDINPVADKSGKITGAVGVGDADTWAPICLFSFVYDYETYKVTLPKNPEVYTIDYTGSTNVVEGENFTFTVTPTEDYEGTPVVKAGDETLTPNEDGSYTVTVNENVTITVEGFTKKVYHTVTLPTSEAYTVASQQSTSVVHGGTFTFTVEVAEGYEGTPVVKAGGETLTPNENGSYTITVTESIAIEVSGITRHFEGYGVQMSEDKSITAGEMAEVQIPVLAGEGIIYNAYDLTLTYDADIVNYESCVAANENDEFTVEAEDGTIRIMGYGPDKVVGTSPVTLTFSGNAVGNADVELTVARVDIGEHAIGANAPEATISDDGITVINVSGYTVTLDEGLKADTTLAQNGVDYVFYPTDADNYTYEVTVTVGDETFTVGANADGSFTIPGAMITGNIVLTAVMTPKEYDVVINGDDVTGANKATYNKDYTFRVDKKDGYTYSVTVKINNTEYTGFIESNGTYTIPGTAITGPIVITVTKTPIPGGQVTVTKPGYVTGDDNATKGQDYTFTVPEEEGYTYGDVKVTVGGTDISAQVQKNADGSYTIPGAYVTGTVVIEVSRVSSVNVDVASYITLDDGNVMYLVTASGTIAEGSAAKYDGQNMYWSEKYEAYAWLVVSTASLEDMKAEAQGKVAVGAGSAAGEIAYAGDVNGTNVIDINDAQLTYDMYNAKYADFTDVSILKFLCADVNGSTNVNVDDAAAVVAAIP